LHILDSIDEEEDETLIELAKILSSFLECIGGKAHAIKILKILEILLVVDEQSVRNEALNSYKLILLQINPSDIEGEIIDLINRLLAKEYATHKIPAIDLIPTIYSYLSQSNKSIIVKYK
jgi:hypothetical protein